MFKRIFSIMLIGLALSVPVHAAGTYGPVRSQDTLWAIASKLKPKGNVTVQQTMLALYYKNPSAFDGNINHLLKGARLKAPTYAEVRRYDIKGAVRETRRQNKYWRRGVDLPKTTPPKIPDIKDPAKAKASQANTVVAEKPLTTKAVASKHSREVANVAAPPVETSPPAPIKAPAESLVMTPAAISASLGPAVEKEIVALRTQLKAEEEKNQRLTDELKALQSKQAQSGSTPAIEEQVKQLKANLKELETVLGQKDNHIKTLQASLKSASEAIKSQHEDNMRLADKLREVSPDSLPPKAETTGKPGLTLASVQDENKAAAESVAATTTAATSAASTEGTPADVAAAAPGSEAAALAQVWADGGKPAAGAPGNPVLKGSGTMPANDVKPGSVRLTEMLGFKASQPTASPKDETRRSISPLALAIALISLLFIVALLWRALVQQRELRRIEAEEERMAVRMRKRLEDNSVGAVAAKREPLTNLSTPPGLNF